MIPEKVLLRCSDCGTVNKVSVEKINGHIRCGNCGNDIQIARNPVEASTVSFQKDVIQWPGVTLVEFWAPWCQYCKGLSPILDEIASEKAGVIKVVKVNTEAEPYLSQMHQVQSVPMMVLFNGGKPVNQVAGALTKHQLMEWISSAL